MIEPVTDVAYASIEPQTPADPDELPVAEPLAANKVWTVDELVLGEANSYSSGTLIGRSFFTSEVDAKEAVLRHAAAWLKTIGTMDLDEFTVEVSQAGTVLRIDAIGERLVPVHRRIEAAERALF